MQDCPIKPGDLVVKAVGLALVSDAGQDRFSDEPRASACTCFPGETGKDVEKTTLCWIISNAAGLDATI